MDNQLQNYITQSRQAGSSDEQIKKNLLDSGWGEEEVGEALGGTETRTRGIKPVKNKSSLIYWLVLLLVIVAVFLFVLTRFNIGREEARDSTREAHIQSFKIAFEMFNDSEGYYPLSVKDIDVERCLDYTWKEDCSLNIPEPVPCVEFDEEIAQMLRPYFGGNIPQDPLAEESERSYRFSSNGEGYFISAKLENADNKPKGAYRSGKFNADCSCEGEYYCISN